MIHFVENDTSFIVLLANLTLYIAFYVIVNIYIYILYFDGGCQPYWIWPSRRPHTKTNIILVCLLSYNFNGKRQFICTSGSSGTRYIAFND